jgi:hypothetical protein
VSPLKLIAAKSAPAPRMGDVANLARSVDRMDSFDMRLGRVEAKLDHLIFLVEKTLPKVARK